MKGGRTIKTKPSRDLQGSAGKRPPKPRVVRATVSLARAQAAWLVSMDPWKSLGYSAAGLSRWLAKKAAKDEVYVALARQGRSGVKPRRTAGRTRSVRGHEVQAVVVVENGVLLGDFMSLLAVRPEHQGLGVGRVLLQDRMNRTFRTRRWFYTSSDAANIAAGRFYRQMGFRRVGRLPDLIAKGHDEILWRKGGER